MPALFDSLNSEPQNNDISDARKGWNEIGDPGQAFMSAMFD
jgi:hypothetical protein